MRVYCETTRRYIEIEILFSGKTMPGDGPSPAWRGSGSLSVVNLMNATGYQWLPSQADMRGKSPADAPFMAVQRPVEVQR